MPNAPTVSIGVPVFNGASSIRAMMDALLAQTFADVEIIVSDNASTDKTPEICADFARQDSRIRYIPQNRNIGPELNFKVVLAEARGRYFMWSACDDIRSPDFIQENVAFLEKHSDYVASTSPNYLGSLTARPAIFSLDGTLSERMCGFLDHGWVSHGIFYAVIRTDILRQCELVGETFFGIDWGVDLFLASRGKIHRTANGYMLSHVSGISSRPDVWKKYRTHAIGWVVPFHRFSLYALRLSAALPWRDRLNFIKRLIKLNILTGRAQLLAEAKLLAVRGESAGGVTETKP